jgi:hypothetical protein
MIKCVWRTTELHLDQTMTLDVHPPFNTLPLVQCRSQESADMGSLIIPHILVLRRSHGCADMCCPSTPHPLAALLAGICSGQSNMWLPVANSFSRNETVAAIKVGNYSNVRLMAGTSGDTVYTNKQMGVNTAKDYGNGTCVNAPGRGNSTIVLCSSSNPWMTAQDSVAVGESSKDGGTYPLFAFGATCWYFAARLAELGVTTPIGIANTAIGGQRIEECVTFPMHCPLYSVIA